MIIREAIAGAIAVLKTAGIETPALDASLLLAQTLNISRTALTAAGTEPLSEEALAVFRGLINRRLNGECTAYILGKKEFRGLEFLVNPSVLVPRPDTETLVEAAIATFENQQPRSNTEEEKEFISKTPCNSVSSVVKNSFVNDNAIRVLDLCAGSGAVAISLKNEMRNLEIWATDISAEALETAKTNAARLLPDSTIHFYQGDLYNALPPAHSSLLIPNSPLPSPNCSFLIPNSPPPTPHSPLLTPHS